MLGKNVFGDIQYEVGDFFIPHMVGGDGKYHILKHEPWKVTDAYILDEEFVVWDKTPAFDSFVQTVKYLKDNIEQLI